MTKYGGGCLAIRNRFDVFHASAFDCFELDRNANKSSQFSRLAISGE